MSGSPEEMGWRQGRKVGRTLYLNGTLIGMVDSTEIAAEVVAAMNGQASPDALAPTMYVHGGCAAFWVPRRYTPTTCPHCGRPLR